MDTMDNVPNATAANRFIGIYLDVYPNLAKVRVAGSNPVVRSPAGLLVKMWHEQAIISRF
jgi:hypothetical protein